MGPSLKPLSTAAIEPPLPWALPMGGFPGATTIVGLGEAGAAGLGERARGSELGANEVR